MPRGGKREGAGGKPKWKHGKTKTIRVPESLADEILEIAEGLDQGLSFIVEKEAIKVAVIDYDTQSKTVDLSGVSLRQVNGVLAVYLEDLVKKGYSFLPERITQLVEARLRKLEIDRRIKHGNN